MARIAQCNVFESSGAHRRFWRFSASANGQVTLASERSGQPPATLARRHGGKSWAALWQPKLNIAWLPVDQAFLRVVQLPKCEFDEVLAMVEFQLERLSPLPLTQMVWSVELVPYKGTAPTETQTVVVVIAARHVVEEHLGRLAAEGYLPDRLEPPFLHQLLATKVESDGIWLYPHTSETGSFCLAAWWYGGALQALNIIHLTTPENWGAEIGEEIRKAAWAGELEGWLTSPPRWHLVADEQSLATWQPILAPVAERAVEAVKPMDAADLATVSARRAAREESKANLVPAEFAARCHQQFVDRLWMRGLGAALFVYVIAVASYFTWLQVLRYQKNDLDSRIAALKPTHEKVQEIKARIAVQEEQIALRYAALDCLRAAAEKMPEELKLKNFQFSSGNRLFLVGEVPAGKGELVSDFVEALGQFKIEGRPFFESVGTPSIQPSGWSLTAYLPESRAQ